MAIKLNLLPQDYAISDSVAGILKIAKPLNVILLTIFLLTTVGMSIFFVVSSVSIKNLNSDNETLKNKIQAQQSAQQQVVLLKDRLGKIKKVYLKPNAEQNLSSIDGFVNDLPSTVSVSELTIDFQKITMLVNFKNNTDLRNFMSSLRDQQTFSNISIDSFSYNKTDGYIVGLVFVVKSQNKTDEK